MKTNKKQFQWKCGHEVFCKSNPALSEHCSAKSKGKYATAADAARAGLLTHFQHRTAIYVTHTTKGVVGNAVGLNFHNTKS